MKRLIIASLIIMWLGFLGSNTAHAGYLDNLRSSDDDRITGIYNNDTSGTTLRSIYNPSTGNTTYYQNGRPEYVNNKKGELYIDYIYDGAIPIEERVYELIEDNVWLAGFSNTPQLSYIWYYKNGKRDYAKDKDGKMVADSIYFNELKADGYFEMNIREKEDYLRSKCPDANTGITELRYAIDEAYQSGETEGFTITFARKEDGSTVAYSAKFYDRNGKVWKEISLYNVGTSDSASVDAFTITPLPANEPKDNPGKTIEEIKALPTVENYSGDDDYDPAAGGKSTDDLDEE